MSNMLDDTLENAKCLTESAKEGAQHAASSARSTFLDGLNAFTGFVSMLRGLEVDDALGWVGLARRRSPISTIALIGCGVAVGAGIGMILAPQSGAELRRTIRARFWGLGEEAKRGLEQAGEAAKQYEQKAEDYAGKAKDTVKETAQDLIGKAKDVAKDVEAKAEGLAGQSPGASSAGSSYSSSYGQSGAGNRTPGQHNRIS